MTGVCVLTGANGFVGRQIAAALAAAGREVVGVTSSAGDPTVPVAAWRKADLLAPAGADTLMDELRPELLIHAAWDTTHGAFWSAPSNYDWAMASLRLLRDFRRAGGRRAVVVGSCAEYDWGHGFCSERTTPLSPGSTYGECKAALFRLATRLAREDGLSLAWARIFLVFGPHEDPRRLVPSVIRSVLGKRPARTSAGAQLRDFLSVEDCGAAIAALALGEVEGPVNIGSGEARTIAEVARAAAEAAGDAGLLQLGAMPARPDDPPVLIPDVRRLREEVGFKPALSLAEGLGRSVSWWREMAH
jgi:nucleoside-diphosphate-sugar epimerase